MVLLGKSPGAEYGEQAERYWIYWMDKIGFDLLNGTNLHNASQMDVRI